MDRLYTMYRPMSTPESLDPANMETVYSVQTDISATQSTPSRPAIQSGNTGYVRNAITNQPSKEEIDELCVNLKILSTTPINTKLSTTGIFLNHEVSAYYIPISMKRWWGGDSRDETIRKLERIVNRTILFSEVVDRNATRNQLIDLLTKSLAGIRNIRETYASCVQTSARIDTIIAKVDAQAAVQTFAGTHSMIQ